MPWGLKKKGNKWIVYKKTDGSVKGTHDSEEKAKAQLRLLHGVEHGWRPGGKK